MTTEKTQRKIYLGTRLYLDHEEAKEDGDYSEDEDRDGKYTYPISKKDFDKLEKQELITRVEAIVDSTKYRSFDVSCPYTSGTKFPIGHDFIISIHCEDSQERHKIKYRLGFWPDGLGHWETPDGCYYQPNQPTLRKLMDNLGIFIEVFDTAEGSFLTEFEHLQGKEVLAYFTRGMLHYDGRIENLEKRLLVSIRKLKYD